MSKVQVKELTGAALDWAVAECEGYDVSKVEWHDEIVIRRNNVIEYYNPSTNWGWAGSIIEQENITLIRCDDDYGVDSEGFCNNKRIPVWAAEYGGRHGAQEGYSSYGEPCGSVYEISESDCVYGPTPLVAAMRCYVASKLGDEIEIPEEMYRE